MKELPNYQDHLIFYVNGQKIDDPKVDPRTTLANYIRQKLKLTGTKIGCNEGGCGACTVMISELTSNGTIKYYSVNACLTLVCFVHGKAVTTVEGIGSVRNKLHPVQEVFSKGHGSQCGYCTPGFIMAMYSLLRNNPHPAKQEIDEALQGNLCRCTGYRPILESFYAFAKAENICRSTSEQINGFSQEHSLLNGNGFNCSNSNGNGGCCKGSKGQGCCLNGNEKGSKLNERKEKIGLSDQSKSRPYDPTQDPVFPADLLVNRYDNDYLRIEHESCKLFRPVNLNELLELKKFFPEAKIVVGNTEIGIEMKFKNCNYPVLINPTAIQELKRIEIVDNGLFIGAAVSLADMETSLHTFIKTLKVDWNFAETKTKVFVAFSKMLHWFAGKHIRNAASPAGNLMTASPISDLNPLFMASGSVAIFESEKNGRREIVIDETFFPSYRKTKVDPNEVLTGIRIPFSSENEHFAGYKQAQRREDDIAIVNAGMRVVFQHGTNVIEDIQLSFGGMAPTTVMVTKVMKQLIGREWNNQLLEDVTGHMLLENLPLPPGVPGGMERYRQTLCLSFFYKFYLTVCQELHKKGIIPDDIPNLSQSGIEDYKYSPMEAIQIYPDVVQDQQSHDAVGRPEMHLSGEKHTTGEAVYCDDVQIAGALHASFVLSRKGHAKIISVDASAALKLPGVVAYLDHRDIPKNCRNVTGIAKDEQIFIENEVTAFGQIIGVIVAETSEVARRGSELVKVYYEDLPTIVTTEQAIKAKSFLDKPIRVTDGDSDRVISESEHILEGEVRTGGQEHFYLETHACIVIPKEGEELEVISSTQSASDIQREFSHVFGIPMHKIVVKVKRIGGGFGGKETAALKVSLPCAVAAIKLRRPIRCSVERFDDMALSGGRHPFLGKYKIAYSKDGKLTAYHIDMYSNGGFSSDLSTAVMQRGVLHIENAYKIPNLQVSGTVCKTNCLSSTAFRGFGSPQAMFIMEHCITEVAYNLGIHPETLREKNFYEEGDSTFYKQRLEKVNNKRCWNECIEMSNYKERRRQIEEFNRNNRWKKRGISVIPTKYGINFGLKSAMQAGALVHIYRDGSVLISHAGMEMGQGLHTKMAQIATRVLGVPLSNIFINETSTDKVPNTSATAASVGSDINGPAVKNACEILLSRLKPFMDKFPQKTWPEICELAYMEQTNLSVNGFYKLENYEQYNFETNTGQPYLYFTYGTACSEVEIDCLTGDHRVLRTDIVMDVGDSLNPAIDIGQIEGGFVQGYGLYTMEDFKYSPTGLVYTRGPGTYKIPSVDDIPKQFNVKLLKGSSNPTAIFSSKAIGEPPLFLGSSVFFAIKDAVRSARQDAGLTGLFRFDSPATPERIRLACEDNITSKISIPEPGTFQPWTVQL